MLLECGILISGYFTGSEVRADKNGEAQQVIAVSVGLDAYRVYMKTGQIADLHFGDEVVIKCRCYVGRSGTVIFTDGEIVERS